MRAKKLDIYAPLCYNALGRRESPLLCMTNTSNIQCLSLLFSFFLAQFASLSRCCCKNSLFWRCQSWIFRLTLHIQFRIKFIIFEYKYNIIFFQIISIAPCTINNCLNNLFVCHTCSFI